MAKFIEVTIDRKKKLINTSFIETAEACHTGTTIYCSNMFITVNENYTEIKKMLMEGEEDG